MAKDTIAAPVAQRPLGDIADDVDCTISILHDLLKLALQECPSDFGQDCKANSAIRAAKRYVDDLSALNQDLFKLHFAAKGGV